MPEHSARPFGPLFAELRAAESRTPLQHAAQLALQVELTTIPAYLTGMYSILDSESEAYQALRAVVMEEMFHVNQAANLVVALGALPRFTGDAAPTYPTYLPHANTNTTPLVGLYRASPDVFSGVYAAIENPAPAGAPPQGDEYDSIAQLYAALSDALRAYPGNPCSPQAPNGRQRTDIYLGKFGGSTKVINDKSDAQKAIEEIVRQGEGAVPPGSPLVPLEPYGAYNHYGERTDGTYGPILGTPFELSHFIRFRKVANAASFPETAAILSNPKESLYTNKAALNASRAFNNAYSAMLRAFEQTFHTGGDPYFGLVLTMMHEVLPALSRKLMKTPAFDGGDPAQGPFACPTWSYVEVGSITEGLRAARNGVAALEPGAATPLGKVSAKLDSMIRLSEEAAR